MPAHEIRCPFCGEPFTISLDDNDGAQSLISDCEICCRPIVVTASITCEGVQWCNVAAE